MQDRWYREERRLVLTNEEIKADMKRDALLNFAVSAPVVIVPIVLDWEFLKLPMPLLEKVVTFWPIAIPLAVLTFAVAMILFLAIKRVITYTYAICCNRFFVTIDTLVDKEEGVDGLKKSSEIRLLFVKPNVYRFTGATYKIAVEIPHFRRWKNVAMSGKDLFRQSHFGDSFVLVSLKPGKPILIYPANQFDYQDSSPR